MLSDNISSRIRFLRIEKGITQEHLAENAKIDVSYLGKVERGQIKNIKLDTLDKIISALEMDYVDFFSFDDTGKVPSKKKLSNVQDLNELISSLNELDKNRVLEIIKLSIALGK